jgi:hypothetical protein
MAGSTVFPTLTAILRQPQAGAVDSEMAPPTAGERLPGNRRNRETCSSTFLQAWHGMAVPFAFKSQTCKTPGSPPGIRLEGDPERNFASRQDAGTPRTEGTARTAWGGYSSVNSDEGIRLEKSTGSFFQTNILLYTRDEAPVPSDRGFPHERFYRFRPKATSGRLAAKRHKRHKKIIK